MDDADISDNRIEITEAYGLFKVRKAVQAIPVGTPGECDKCGEDMPRLVNGWCCRCRDKYHV